MPKIKCVSYATQTCYRLLRLQMYRELCARRLQGNMDGANTLESMAYLQTATPGALTTQQHVPRIELSAVLVFSMPK